MLRIQYEPRSSVPPRPTQGSERRARGERGSADSLVTVQGTSISWRLPLSTSILIELNSHPKVSTITESLKSLQASLSDDDPLRERSAMAAGVEQT